MDTNGAVIHSRNLEIAVNHDEEAAPADVTKASLHELFNKMFSKANFDKDKYLQAGLNDSQAVPIEIVLQSPDVLDITSDADLIKTVLYESKALLVSEDGVRPLVRPEQTTLILRDIPSDTNVDIVRDIFLSASNPSAHGSAGPLCPPVTSIRADMNDTWFVSFATEAEARQALEAIRSSRFNGKTVKARLKTESANKAYFSANSTPTAAASMYPSARMAQGPNGEFFSMPFPGEFPASIPMMPAGAGQPPGVGMVPVGMPATMSPAAAAMSGGMYYGYPMQGGAGGPAYGMPMMQMPYPPMMQMGPSVSPNMPGAPPQQMINSQPQWMQVAPNGMPYMQQPMMMLVNPNTPGGPAIPMMLPPGQPLPQQQQQNRPMLNMPTSPSHNQNNKNRKFVQQPYNNNNNSNRGGGGGASGSVGGGGSNTMMMSPNNLNNRNMSNNNSNRYNNPNQASPQHNQHQLQQGAYDNGGSSSATATGEPLAIQGDNNYRNNYNNNRSNNYGNRNPDMQSPNRSNNYRNNNNRQQQLHQQQQQQQQHSNMYNVNNNQYPMTAMNGNASSASNYNRHLAQSSYAAYPSMTASAPLTGGTAANGTAAADGAPPAVTDTDGVDPRAAYTEDQPPSLTFTTDAELDRDHDSSSSSSSSHVIDHIISGADTSNALNSEQMASYAPSVATAAQHTFSSSSQLPHGVYIIDSVNAAAAEGSLSAVPAAAAESASTQQLGTSDAAALSSSASPPAAAAVSGASTSSAGNKREENNRQKSNNNNNNSNSSGNANSVGTKRADKTRKRDKDGSGGGGGKKDQTAVKSTPSASFNMDSDFPILVKGSTSNSNSSSSSSNNVVSPSSDSHASEEGGASGNHDEDALTSAPHTAATVTSKQPATTSKGYAAILRGASPTPVAPVAITEDKSNTNTNSKGKTSRGNGKKPAAQLTQTAASVAASSHVDVSFGLDSASVLQGSSSAGDALLVDAAVPFTFGAFEAVSISAPVTAAAAATGHTTKTAAVDSTHSFLQPDTAPRVKTSATDAADPVPLQFGTISLSETHVTTTVTAPVSAVSSHSSSGGHEALAAATTAHASHAAAVVVTGDEADPGGRAGPVWGSKRSFRDVLSTAGGRAHK